MLQRRTQRTGQSMVEMALLLPFIIMIIFGIIDMGWYIFGYATVYQAARNGAEKAAEIPPYPSKLSPLDRSDLCVSSILSATLAGTPEVLFRDIASGNSGNTFGLSYPSGKRQLGEPIQLDLVYNIQPLTPFWRLITFGSQGTMRVQMATRRSIESLGDNPNSPNLVACQP
ncbi:TadE family protein [Kouleothrix sp.]|uniref:TadE family protein n=1 Tax=Kouleothrix sp. TaxID=2779161 RepID=UPI00391AD7C4